MSSSTNNDLLKGMVTVEWLNDALKSNEQSQHRVHVFDASWYLPIANRNPGVEYLHAHIPTARFFDIDYHADRESTLPHMFPSESYMTELLQSYGINEGDTIVCYDASSAYTAAARLWFTFLVFGIKPDNIKLLDGGFKEWQTKFPDQLEHGEPKLTLPKGNIQAHFNSSMVYDMPHVLDELKKPVDERPYLVDARDSPRFKGEAPEPRPAKHRGHLPGALNMFHAGIQTVTVNGRQGFRPQTEIEQIAQSIGLPPASEQKKPILCYCGSGVTASSVLFALWALGYHDLSLYDGSMAEYLNDDSVPIET